MFLGFTIKVYKVLQGGRNYSATCVTYIVLICFPLIYTVVQETIPVCFLLYKHG